MTFDLNKEDLSKEPKFRDALRDLWTVRLTTDVFIEICQRLDMVEKRDWLNPGKQLDALWLCVKASAQARGVSRKQFFEERLTLPFIGDALRALGVAMAVCFPTSSDVPEKLRVESEDPLE